MTLARPCYLVLVNLGLLTSCELWDPYPLKSKKGRTRSFPKSFQALKYCYVWTFLHLLQHYLYWLRISQLGFYPFWHQERPNKPARCCGYGETRWSHFLSLVPQRQLCSLFTAQECPVWETREAEPVWAPRFKPRVQEFTSPRGSTFS